MSPQRAMILAAGRGERLRPLTDRTPKPLIDINGQPLIERHLAALASAGFRQVVINVAWLGDRIIDHLGHGDAFGVDIRYSPEPEGALETAGGIIQALPMLGEAPFVVVSADVLTDFPFQRLRQAATDDPAHLVMVDNPPHHPEGDFGLEAGRIRAGGESRLTYSGIAVFHPRLFDGHSAGRLALRPVLEKAIAAGQVSGQHYTGRWADIGTPERLAAAQQSFSESA